jgi:hypothetical protein
LVDRPGRHPLALSVYLGLHRLLQSEELTLALGLRRQHG